MDESEMKLNMKQSLKKRLSGMHAPLQKKSNIFTNCKRIKKCSALKDLCNNTISACLSTSSSYKKACHFFLQNNKVQGKCTKPMRRPSISSSLTKPCLFFPQIITSPCLLLWRQKKKRER